MNPNETDHNNFFCPACGATKITALSDAVIPQPVIRIKDDYDCDAWEIDNISFGHELFSCDGCHFSSWSHKAFIPEQCAGGDRAAAERPVSEAARSSDVLVELCPTRFSGAAQRMDDQQWRRECRVHLARTHYVAGEPSRVYGRAPAHAPVVVAAHEERPRTGKNRTSAPASLVRLDVRQH